MDYWFSRTVFRNRAVFFFSCFFLSLIRNCDFDSAWKLCSYLSGVELFRKRKYFVVRYIFFCCFWNWNKHAWTNFRSLCLIRQSIGFSLSQSTFDNNFQPFSCMLSWSALRPWFPTVPTYFHVQIWSWFGWNVTGITEVTLCIESKNFNAHLCNQWDSIPIFSSIGIPMERFDFWKVPDSKWE